MENTLNMLKKATAGLLFMSESDNPFEIVSFPSDKLTALTPEAVVNAVGKTAGTKVEQQEIDYFFRNQTQDLPEHTADDKARTQRFRELVTLLKKQLNEVAVFRIGETQIEAYILGKMQEGNIGGLKTLLIET
jgi:hypothetical protein